MHPFFEKEKEKCVTMNMPHVGINILFSTKEIEI